MWRHPPEVFPCLRCHTSLFQSPIEQVAKLLGFHGEKYEGAMIATEDMLTPDLLTWSLGASVLAVVRLIEKLKRDAEGILFRYTTPDKYQNSDEAEHKSIIFEHIEA